jgi:hypothetical protein
MRNCANSHLTYGLSLNKQPNAKGAAARVKQEVSGWMLGRITETTNLHCLFLVKVNNATFEHLKEISYVGNGFVSTTITLASGVYV